MAGAVRSIFGSKGLLLALAKAFALFSLLLLLPPHWQGYAQSEKAPSVDVIDGDTLILDGNLYKLQGIDAPELGQTCLNAGVEWSCGLEAALALRKMVTISGDLACHWVNRETDPADFSASCTIGTEDLGRRMLLSGYAVALENVVPGYADAENTAKTGKLGVWRGEFVVPSLWRQANEIDDPTRAASLCVIKGMITESGAKIYRLPGDEGYDAVEIDPAKGERLFCSDDAARVAGWSRYPK